MHTTSEKFLCDQNEAPCGYEAVASVSNCLSCDFYVRSTVECRRPEGAPSCFWWSRKDSTSVIFKKKETTSENT
jgi:hypothetical protein